MEVLWRRFDSQIESRLVDEQAYIQITEATVVVATAVTRFNSRELMRFPRLRIDMN